MYKDKRDLTFSPSDLMRFMECEYVTWLDRFNLEFPNTIQPDEPTESDKILQQKGEAHESEFKRQLEESGRDVCDLSKSTEKHAATIHAMYAGREIIYQAELHSGNVRGFADFLFRIEAPSELGDYRYEAWDTKLALTPKPYFLVQLACYSDMLSIVQGVMPRHMHLVLGDKTTESFRTEDYLYFYHQIWYAFMEQQRYFHANLKRPPEFSGKEKFGRWTSHVEKLIKETDHLCQVANMRSLHIRRLKDAGIMSMTGLARSPLTDVARIPAETLSTLKRQARLQVESAQLATPKYELIEPQTAGLGLYLLPPASKGDVFFDMEGYPLENDGLEYLFGTTVLEDGQPQFLDWWAHNAEQEKAAFESFIDWLHQRWQADPSMHVYHYAAYEKTALQKLMGKYATKEKELDELLRNEVFVDLFTVVRQSIKVGTPNYSIKSIEKLYRPKRDTEVATALDSIVFYQHWLDKKDGDDWHTSLILKQIRDYNKDDCDSTWQLAAWLRELATKAGVVWQSKEHKDSPDNENAQFRSQAAALASELLSTIPADSDTKTEAQKVRELMAQLLEFHWREARPVFWAMYDRHEMTQQQLYEDPCCLAGLKVAGGRRHEKQSFLYEYEFDANQDTKIDAGNRCFFANDLRKTIVVEEIDPDRGTVTLKHSVKGEAPPPTLSLIKNEFVDPAEIAKSIYRSAQEYKRTGKLSPALDDFFSRRRPRIKGLSDHGDLITTAAEYVAGETAELLTRLDNTTICIQGPPGSGKTYTAAKSIVKLLKAGKRVGITSNSHKAIAHLMQKVAEEATSVKFNLHAVKLQSDAEDYHCQSDLIKPATPNKFFDGKVGSWELVGGTAWAFSKEAAVGLVDYLFVDEAGQVSIANLVGMAPCTKNIVLIGDHMQLAQPLKGVHPGDSGKSVLEYLLVGHQVIRRDFGIFLDRTFRMHGDLCHFISGAVYNDLLIAHSSTYNRLLRPPPNATEFLTEKAGILYVPVPHEGNSQDSDEEAEVIDKIVRELQQSSLLDGNKERPFNIQSDLLVVAPYNMQVRKLRQRLPGVMVGSVDKFQGQEAAVVIVSMCSSTGDASPRGLEFIFSKNRLNVALSRARTLAIVVGSPSLVRTHCRRTEQMELVNLFCRIVENGSSPSLKAVESCV